MAPSFPESKKTFTDIVDGAHGMEGVNLNTVYDEVEAIETFLGPSGSPQSHNSALLTMLVNQYVGGRIYKKDADEIYVGPFRGIIPNATESELNLRSKNSVTTLSASDLDTGTMAEDFYYIYATADSASTEPTFVFSLSDSAPTGYTNYLKIGWFYNETASVLDVTSGFMGNIKGFGGNPNIVKAEGTSDISDPGASYALMTDMEVKFVSTGRHVKVKFSGSLYKTSSGTEAAIKFVVDSADEKFFNIGIDSGNLSVPPDYSTFIDDLAAGEHTIQVYWIGDNLQQNGATYKRELIVEEV